MLKRNNYTNFATGNENPKALYSGEERLRRLRALKEKWDSEGAFGWYNPIR
jgi:hypothetical protein